MCTMGPPFTSGATPADLLKASMAAEHFCHPQRSWGKVMFLHVSVILFTVGVVSQHASQMVSQPGLQGVVSQHALQVVSQHALQQVSRGVSQHSLQVSRPTPRGEVQGSDQGGSPGPHPGGLRCGPGDPPLGVGSPGPHPVGCVSQHALRQTPPPRWLLLRSVRIVLECILVGPCAYKCV